MSIETPLAAVAVADLEEAKEFYARLFGRPADANPMPTLAQWDFEPAGGVQVVCVPEVAGTSMLTLLVSQFDDTITELSSRGVGVGEVVTGVISRVTQLRDPAGNVITLAEIPTE